MPAILQDKDLLTSELLNNLTESKRMSHEFNLAEEAAGHSDAQSPRFTGNWQKQDNTEHSITEDDVKLHRLMEDIKRYIRNIDISNL